MPNRLELPEELASLIEKREQADRRGAEGQEPENRPAIERRTGDDRREEPAGD